MGRRADAAPDRAHRCSGRRSAHTRHRHLSRRGARALAPACRESREDGCSHTVDRIHLSVLTRRRQPDDRGPLRADAARHRGASRVQRHRGQPLLRRRGLPALRQEGRGFDADGDFRMTADRRVRGPRERPVGRGSSVGANGPEVQQRSPRAVIGRAFSFRLLVAVSDMSTNASRRGRRRRDRAGARVRGARR